MTNGRSRSTTRVRVPARQGKDATPWWLAGEEQIAQTAFGPPINGRK
jgi:hypothetical protein